MKDGVVNQLSIGYDAIIAPTIDGIRHLQEVRLWDASPVAFAANPEARITAVKGAIPFGETPRASEDEAWDAGTEVRDATVEDLAIMCAWVDSANKDLKTAYKLPHHKASGHTVVWRAVAAAMAALLGARGGVQIPDADRKGVYNHLVKHYAQFDKTPPDFKEINIDEFKIRDLERFKAALDHLQALYDEASVSGEPGKSTPIDEESKEAAELESIIGGLKAENDGFSMAEAEKRIDAILSKI
jgi:hypothetical protein